MKSLTTSITTLTIFSIAFFGCKKEQIEIPALPEVIVAETSAVYTLRFEGNWNLANQPQEYPVNAHFSPLIGWCTIAELKSFGWIELLHQELKTWHNLE
mgnify:CR=1 FL=1